MKNKLTKKTIAGVFAAIALTGVVAFATNYGTSSDPLVSLSYLTDIFKPSVVSEVQTQINEAKSELTTKFNNKLSSAGLGTSSGFEVITLSDGQVLVGEVGTQVLLRLGSAVCSASATPGLVDTTTAGTLSNGGSLSANHLYMVTIVGNGIKASGEATILVSGGYTLQ